MMKVGMAVGPVRIIPVVSKPESACFLRGVLRQSALVVSKY